MFIFNWFNKKNKIQAEKPSIEFEDSLEIALWDIKEKYDLETEEVEKTVNKGHFKKLIRKYFRG